MAHDVLIPRAHARRAALAVGLAWLASLGAAGADAPARAAARAKTIPAAALARDLDLLRRILDELHPGLDRYNTKDQVDARLAALRAELGRDRSLADVYLALSEFLATLKCGHSYPNFFNQSDEAARALFEGRDRVPFLFRWLDGRMIVTRDLTPDRRLPAGTEVRAIGGHPAGEILGRLLAVARADGGNDAKRVAYLEVRGKDRYEAFDVFLPLVYPDLGEPLALDVVGPGETGPRRLVVAAHDHAERAALAEASRTSGASGKDLWRFETLDGGAGYLRMPGWALYNVDWDWKAFLDRGIDALIDRGAPALIVDIRDNEGGLDVGDAILERVATARVPGPALLRHTRYRAVPADLKPYLRTWDKSFADWGDAARPAGPGFFRMTKFDDGPDGDALTPRGRRFAGRLIVLINAANSSATYQFAQRVKASGLGTLVGTPTGGNLRGINGGAFFFATLPGSGIEFDVPLVATFPPGTLPDGRALPFADVPDAGIAPDVLVRETPEDIANGRDPALEAAKRLALAPR